MTYCLSILTYWTLNRHVGVFLNVFLSVSNAINIAIPIPFASFLGNLWTDNLIYLQDCTILFIQLNNVCNELKLK